MGIAKIGRLSNAIICMGMEATNADTVTPIPEENFWGKNLNGFAICFDKREIKNTTEKESKNPTQKSCVGDIKRIITHASPIAESPSYRIPSADEINKTAHITVALSEDAENPHTPE